jgi:hypothetical protein
VTLGTDRDALGQPRLKLDWRLTEQDMRSAMRTQEIVAGALTQIGLGRWYQELREPLPPSNLEGGYGHHPDAYGPQTGSR